MAKTYEQKQNTPSGKSQSGRQRNPDGSALAPVQYNPPCEITLGGITIGDIVKTEIMSGLERPAELPASSSPVIKRAYAGTSVDAVRMCKNIIRAFGQYLMANGYPAAPTIPECARWMASQSDLAELDYAKTVIACEEYLEMYIPAFSQWWIKFTEDVALQGSLAGEYSKAVLDFIAKSAQRASSESGGAVGSSTMIPIQINVSVK